MFFFNNKLLKSAQIKGIILLSISLLAAIILGLVLASVHDMRKIEDMLENNAPALPSKVYDRNHELITEFFSDEKREVVTLDRVPNYLVEALIMWEDESFYHHNGFNLLSIFRASVNNYVLRMPVSGASTLTQQLARTLFLTNKFSWTRKIKELFIAMQLEKKYSKNEILTLYLNHVPFGYGTNGVQIASKFYFDKDIEDITYAEAASLITLISNPTYYSIIKNGKNHKDKQELVLKKMVKAGIISELESKTSIEKFWLNWNSKTHSARGAFFNREDKAPFFSDWVLSEIQKNYPEINVFRDGLSIYTTLDLRSNMLVDEMMNAQIEKSQKFFEVDQERSFKIIQTTVLDTVFLLTDTYSINNIRVRGNRVQEAVMKTYNKDCNTAINLFSQAFGINLLNEATDVMFDKTDSVKQIAPEVQGAFIALDNETGQIITMYGGKKFDPNNRFNFAMQARKQPGSSFKPFIYSAALDAKVINPATVINDEEYIFTFGLDDPETWYKPVNYGEKFYGRVNIRKALKRSLNIPALKIFYAFRDEDYRVPIDRAATLMGIDSQEDVENRIPSELSTALGTCAVSPVEMATGFLSFANQGQRRIPNCIIEIKDRDGRTLYTPWKDLQKYYRENSKKLQIISPQNAYIMTDILKGTVSSDGTLSYAVNLAREDNRKIPDVEFSGKTGTTQNWSDAWVIGSSPKITASVWLGFKENGLSLGYEQSGAASVGPIWYDFMIQYHQDDKDLKFKAPEDGIGRGAVCRESGLQPSEYCDKESIYSEYFLPGTYPGQVCDYCKDNKLRVENNRNSFQDFFDKNYSKEILKQVMDTSNIKVDNSLINESVLNKKEDSSMNNSSENSKKTALDEFRSYDTNLDVDNDLLKMDLFDSNKDESKDDKKHNKDASSDINSKSNSSSSSGAQSSQSSSANTDLTADKPKNQ